MEFFGFYSALPPQFRASMDKHVAAAADLDEADMPVLGEHLNEMMNSEDIAECWWALAFYEKLVSVLAARDTRGRA